MEIAQKRKAQSVNNNRNKMIQCMSENLYVFTLCGGDYTISDLSYGIKKNQAFMPNRNRDYGHLSSDRIRPDRNCYY